MIYQRIPLSELQIKKDDILREIGYKGTEPDKLVLSHITEFLDYIHRNIITEYKYRICEGKIVPEGIQLEEGTYWECGKVITSLLQGSQKFLLFAATAGLEFEIFAQKINKEGDMLGIFLMDAIGSCIVEKTGDYMELRLEGEYETLQHTNRFSPGYCGWPLSDQKKLFRLLGENPCGIKLSETFLMNPIKSISGIIGIGEKVTQKKYGCKICNLDNCYKRNLK